MYWVDIIVVIVLILAFLGGLKDGAIKTGSSLVALLIAIPVTGYTYRILGSILSFLPGQNWENFIGFFVTMGIVIVILHLAFFIPRKIIGAVWKEGILFRVLGAVINTLGAMISLVVFVLLVQAYPIFGSLERWVSDSSILTALASVFSFIKLLLPAAFG